MPRCHGQWTMEAGLSCRATAPVLRTLYAQTPAAGQPSTASQRPAALILTCRARSACSCTYTPPFCLTLPCLHLSRQLRRTLTSTDVPTATNTAASCLSTAANARRACCAHSSCAPLLARADSYCLPTCVVELPLAAQVQVCERADAGQCLESLVAGAGAPQHKGGQGREVCQLLQRLISHIPAGQAATASADVNGNSAHEAPHLGTR